MRLRSRHVGMLLAAVMLIIMCLPCVAFAATATAAIDCTAFSSDQTGSGWTWTQSSKTFTLAEDLTITITRTDGSDYYGVKLPDGATLDADGHKLWVSFLGYEAGGTGQGTAVQCTGALTITGNGLVGVYQKDGGDTFALSAAGALTLDGVRIINNTGSGVIASAISVTDYSLIQTSWYPLFNTGAVSITGNNALLLISNEQGAITYNDNGFNTTGVPVLVIDGQTSTSSQPVTLAQSVTLSSSVALPSSLNLQIPSDKTITIASPTTLSLPDNTTNKGTITVQVGATLNNPGTLVNRGTINNDGELNNTGTLYQYGRLTGNAVIGNGRVITPGNDEPDDDKPDDIVVSTPEVPATGDNAALLPIFLIIAAMAVAISIPAVKRKFNE